MPKEGSILKYNHEEKSMKAPFVIYADMESLNAASGYSLFTYCSFDVPKNKHDYYRGKDHQKLF